MGKRFERYPSPQWVGCWPTLKGQEIDVVLTDGRTFHGIWQDFQNQQLTLSDGLHRPHVWPAAQISEITRSFRSE